MSLHVGAVSSYDESCLAVAPHPAVEQRPSYEDDFELCELSPDLILLTHVLNYSMLAHLILIDFSSASDTGIMQP